MILIWRGNCIASGTVTSKGGEFTFIGQRSTPKFKFSVRVENRKDENGEWASKYLDCELFGKYAEKAPDLSGGEMVLCAGQLETRNWAGRDGEPRTSTTLKCDFVTVASVGSGRMDATPPEPGGFLEADDEEDGDLPF